MDSTAQINRIVQKLNQAELPHDVSDRLQLELGRIELTLKNNSFSLEADRQLTYLDFVCSLPWSKSHKDILDLKRAKEVLDKNHFGLDIVKDRILEYLSVRILNEQRNLRPSTPVLSFVGLVGSGKTTLAYSIAESLGRPIARIPFGGLGSAAQLRGESRLKPDAEPGLIIKSLNRTQVKNPVILLDELDRVTESARADIMGVLVELLDPEQNMAFLDHYVDFPFDLSQVLFISTANNLSNIATAVLDRLEIIEMPFYTDQQKITIARDYLLPSELEKSGMDAKSVTIDPSLWSELVRPLGFDGGIRSLKRNLDMVVRKAARMKVEGNPGPFIINHQNFKQYMTLS